MAKKRRKRRSGGTGPRPKQGQRKQRAAVEPAVRRTARDERPRGPWGSFPLTELTILVGLILLLVGFFGTGPVLIAAGITIAGLGGLELAIREHFAGYRSHSALLAFACAVFIGGALVGLAVLVFGSFIPAIAVAAAAIAFVPAFRALREAFRRASGGFSYRIGRLKG